MRQLLTFGGLSLVGTAAHYALLVLWVSVWHWPAWPGSVAGASLGLVLNFVLHARYTFADRRADRAAFLRFCAAGGAGFVINALVMGAGLWLGLHWLAAQVGATLAAFLSNYLLAKFWAFREPKDTAA